MVSQSFTPTSPEHQDGKSQRFTMAGQYTRPIKGGRGVGMVYLSVIIVISCAIFLHFIGQYALIGRNPFQFFADSSTYMGIYSGFLPPPDGAVGISYNFLGPMLILSLTGGNLYLVMIVNVAMFMVSIVLLSRYLDLNPIKLSLIQLINPMTLSSLMSVNKEIISFPVLACLIVGYKKRSPYFIAAALVFSMLARWELTVFCVVLIGAYFVRRINRYFAILCILLSVSIAYYLAQNFLKPVFETVEISTASYTEGSGLFERLIDLQNDGLYFLVAPVKAAHLLFSMGTHISGMMHPIVVYNDQIVATYCLFNIFIFIALIFMKQYNLRNDILMISAIYLVVFSLTPVYAPRYFYPVTILWILIVAGARGGIGQAKVERERGVVHV